MEAPEQRIFTHRSGAALLALAGREAAVPGRFRSTARDHDIDDAVAATGTDAPAWLAVHEELNRLGCFRQPPGW